MSNPVVACVQMRSTTSVAENCSAMEKLVRAAAKDGATYIQTPEMTGLLEKNRARQFENTYAQSDDPTFNTAALLASELGIWLHVGSTPIALGNGKLANRAGVFAPDGSLAATYDKLHMFDVDLDNGESWRESSVYQAGSRARVVQGGLFSLGLSICYDLRFPGLYRDLALAGAEVLACPAAFTRQTGQAHWHTLLRARAIENGAYVIAAAQGGKHQDGRETYGHSMIVDPWGKTVAELDHDEPGFIVAEIDLEKVAQSRQKVPNLSNAQPYALETVSLGEELKQ